MRSMASKLFLALAFMVSASALTNAAEPVPAPKVVPVVKSSVNVPGTVVGPSRTILSFKVNNPDKLELTVVCQASESKFQWFRELSDDPTVASFKVFALVPGEYYLTFLTAKDSKATIVGQVKVQSGAPPPGPDVDPDVTPDGDPDTAPIPGDGLQVLFVFETGTAAKIPPAQQSILYGKTVREYLNAKSPLGPDGKTRQWRIWDKDVDASNEQAVWQEALKRANLKSAEWKPAKDGKGPKTALPWVIISNGRTGYEGPVPETVEEMLKLLKKYGGE